jgi:hypothetical protein
MVQSSQQPALQAKSTETEINLAVSPSSSRPGQPVLANAQAATKDAGRVHIGGGMIHF